MSDDISRPQELVLSVESHVSAAARRRNVENDTIQSGEPKDIRQPMTQKHIEHSPRTMTEIDSEFPKERKWR